MHTIQVTKMQPTLLQATKILVLALGLFAAAAVLVASSALAVEYDSKIAKNARLISALADVERADPKAVDAPAPILGMVALGFTLEDIVFGSPSPQGNYLCTIQVEMRNKAGEIAFSRFTFTRDDLGGRGSLDLAAKACFEGLKEKK